MKERIRITFRKAPGVEVRPTSGSFLDSKSSASGLIVSPIIRVIRPQEPAPQARQSIRHKYRKSTG